MTGRLKSVYAGLNIMSRYQEIPPQQRDILALLDLASTTGMDDTRKMGSKVFET
jgi:hypothetical protein